MDYSFGFDLADTARLVRRAFDRRAVALGVTRAQWRVLLRLVRENGARQVDLADALDMEPITLCRMVDRLAEAGLVERRRDESDRRAWNIHLTDKARPIIDELHDVGLDVQRHALAGISERDLEAVRSVLARVRDNLNSESGEAARKAS